MRNILLLAVLLAPALLASSARAADPALVSGVEKYLRDDEKAFLAAVLTRPNDSAEFDAEAPLALKDPKNLGPFLGLWRGKIVAYAEIDSKLGYPNLDGKYSNFSQLMTAQQKAYMMRRLPTMAEDDRNSLIDYLKKVNDDLQKNGQLTCTLGFCYTKKIVSGIMDHYKTDLTTYVQTPMAQTAKRDAPAAAAAFAAIQKADQEARTAAAKPAEPAPTEVADAPVVKAPVKPVPPKKPAPATKPAPVTPPKPVGPEAGSVVTTKPSGGALDQATDIANRGANGGQVIDGGGRSQQPTGGDAVIVPPSSGGARPTLPAGKPGSESGLTAALPAVPAPATDDMDALLKMRGDKPAPKSWLHRAPAIVGGLLGGLLGALIGFFVGGPVGAIVGGAIGLGAGAGGGYLLGKKLLP